MPTLTDLKLKWFIPMDGSSPDGIPRSRAFNGPSPLRPHTDGNTVTALIDGEEYMRAWITGLQSLRGISDAEFYHAGWRFENMKTLGRTASDSDALQNIIDSASDGVSIYVLACSNLGCLRFNRPSISDLRLRGLRTAFLDNRFPPGGSNHQKLTVFKNSSHAEALVGSVDIAKTRWDSSEHLKVDPNRDPVFGKQTHDVAVRIEGPAVADLEQTYRERWNDPTKRTGLVPFFTPKPLIASPASSPLPSGTHSVQILRTYGVTSALLGYSWSPVGEFTVWASYLNAIKKASDYIYIEDQYFLPFDWPPCHTRSGLARDTDIVYQLGEAMRRGVNVIVVVPGNSTEIWRIYQKYQRDIGINYLQGIRSAGSPGDVIVASLQKEGSDIYVHSKLMIVDDEFVCLGSANIGQRSMTYDSELQVGIVDENNAFARDLRIRLWEEHCGGSVRQLSNAAASVERFKECVSAAKGHLRPIP